MADAARGRASTQAVGGWPELPLAAWRETCETLHLWTQIVGKVRLAKTPWQNHGWHVALYVTARGLTTSPIPDADRSFEIAFDFVDHALDISVSDGRRVRLGLVPQAVADFYERLMRALNDDLGLAVAIDERPCEIPGAVPFAADRRHASYDAEWAHRFFQALVRVDRTFKLFRTGFLGKCSPVHFFWGSFDLAVTRFSGRRAPLFARDVPGVARGVMQEAYSHEVSSAGFWPGGSGVDASFYAYAYPLPGTFRGARVHPESARFDDTLGEFLLPYEAVRAAADPAGTLLAFLQSTYVAAADAAQWERSELERPLGVAGVCPDVGATHPSADAS
ncbi:MAG: DUF5996 family protein [Rudaea sp.]